VMRYPVIIRRGLGVCHGGIISPRCWPALRDATLLLYFDIQWPLDDDFWSLCWLISGNCVTLVLYRGDHQQAAFVESYIHISLRLFIYTC
jgi:hypothetical protein